MIITDGTDNAKEFHITIDYKKNVKLNYPYYLFKLTGGYTYEDGVRKFHNKDDKKGFEVGAYDGVQLCVVL